MICKQALYGFPTYLTSASLFGNLSLFFEAKQSRRKVYNYALTLLWSALFYEFRHYENISSFINGYRRSQNRRAREGRNEKGPFLAFRKNEKRTEQFQSFCLLFFIKKEI